LEAQPLLEQQDREKGSASNWGGREREREREVVFLLYWRGELVYSDNFVVVLYCGSCSFSPGTIPAWSFCIGSV